MSEAVRTAVIAQTEPTERSRPPVRMTRIIPIATIPTNEKFRVMLTIFPPCPNCRIAIVSTKSMTSNTARLPTSLNGKNFRPSQWNRLTVRRRRVALCFLRGSLWPWLNDLRQGGWRNRLAESAQLIRFAPICETAAKAARSSSQFFLSKFCPLLAFRRLCAA
jgi:hypothetical protein